VACSYPVEQDGTVRVLSAGVPGQHAVGAFPLFEDRPGGAGATAQRWSWDVPMRGVPRPAPLSLPRSGLVGFALNGVPLLHDPASSRERWRDDFCYGRADPSTGAYAYLGTPWCLLRPGLALPAAAEADADALTALDRVGTAADSAAWNLAHGFGASRRFRDSCDRPQDVQGSEAAAHAREKRRKDLAAEAGWTGGTRAQRRADAAALRLDASDTLEGVVGYDPLTGEFETARIRTLLLDGNVVEYFGDRGTDPLQLTRYDASVDAGVDGCAPRPPRDRSRDKLHIASEGVVALFAAGMLAPLAYVGGHFYGFIGVAVE
jgi:hypothetical protein